MGKKIKQGSAIIAVVAALAAFAAGPAAARPGSGHGAPLASWGEASWGDASWAELANAQ